MLIQGSVGQPSVTSIQPGTTPTIRQGQLGDVIMSELQRLYINKTYDINPVQFWNKLNEVCTMIKTKQYCGLKFKEGKDLKFPRLN